MIFNEIIALNKLLRDGIVATARNTEYRVGQTTYVKTSESLALHIFGTLAGLKKDGKGRIIIGKAEIVEVHPATEENFNKLAEDSGFDTKTWIELVKKYGKQVKYIYKVKLIKLYAKPSNGKILTLSNFI